MPRRLLKQYINSGTEFPSPNHDLKGVPAHIFIDGRVIQDIEDAALFQFLQEPVSVRESDAVDGKAILPGKGKADHIPVPSDDPDGPDLHVPCDVG